MTRFASRRTRDIAIELEKLGFHFAGRTGKGHCRFVHPRGTVTCAGTPRSPMERYYVVQRARKLLREATT